MQRNETKTEQTATIAVKTDAGQQLLVHEFSRFMRVEFLDGNWSNWTRSGGMFMLDGQRINKLDDQTFQVPASGRILTVVNQQDS